MNNKLKRPLIAMILILTLMFTSVGAFALTTSELAQQEGEEYGSRFGEIDGSQAAEKDYGLNLTSSYTRNRPTSNEIISKYGLTNDSNLYRTTFVRYYLLSYDLSYDSTYRLSNYNKFIEPMDSGLNDGMALGEVQGAIHAVLDFTRNRNSDWQKAYDTFISESSLSARYYLSRDSDIYKTTFENAFKSSYRSSYMTTFHERNIGKEKLNINLYNLLNEGNEIVFNDDLFSVDNAEITIENTTALTLSVPKGAVYNSVPVQLYKVQHSEHLAQVYKDLQSVSSAYTISIANSSGQTVLNKPVELSFDYYGSEYAGIYLWKNNRWEYQYTKFDDEKIYTELPTGYYNGGNYAIFVDATAKNLNQSSYHWARQETYTFMRRGIVADNSYSKLNSPVTRSEFASILYKSLGDNLSVSKKPVFSDAALLKDAKEAIEYVVASRYMFNDANNAFRPNEYVSYGDLEKLFSNIYYRTFTWDEIGQELLHDKYIRSKGLETTAAQIPLGEVIYALHHYMK